MNTMDCDELREVACEVALDLLTGVERASALAHLEECQECRAEVESLASTADELLTLAPAVEPPAGFAAGVLRHLDELAAPRRVRPRRALPRRVGILAAAAAVTIAIVAGVVSFGSSPSATHETATVRSGAGIVVGVVSVSDAHPGTVVLDMHGWTEMLQAYGAVGANNAVLAVTNHDGSVHSVSIPVAHDPSWTESFAVPGVDQSSIATVAIRGHDGALWCSARFT